MPFNRPHFSTVSFYFEGEIVVRRSKTEAGTSRVVPLTQRAAAALIAWLDGLPLAGPDAYLFPRHSGTAFTSSGGASRLAIAALLA